MRKIALLLAVLLGLAGCGGDPEADPEAAPAPGTVEVVVLLEMDATETQKAEIEAELNAIPEASGVTLETREEAFERFKEAFEEDSPELVETVRVEDLPESFHFTVPDRAAAEPLLPDLRELPGVDDVTIPAA